MKITILREKEDSSNYEFSSVFFLFCLLRDFCTQFYPDTIMILSIRFNTNNSTNQHSVSVNLVRYANITVLLICIGFNVDPDPAFHLNADPDPVI